MLEEEADVHNFFQKSFTFFRCADMNKCSLRGFTKMPKGQFENTIGPVPAYRHNHDYHKGENRKVGVNLC